MKNIQSEIEKLSGGTPSEVEEICQHLRPITIEKGHFLLREGNICRQYYFVEEGAIRLYYYSEENDYTVWIGTPGQIFTELDSYLSGQPSRINMEAISEAKVYVIDKAACDSLAERSNCFNTLLRRTVEIAFVNLSRNVISFQSESADSRYNRVVEERDWLLRFPLRYISSFIGVTQSSLSRIRSRKA